VNEGNTVSQNGNNITMWNRSDVDTIEFSYMNAQEGVITHNPLYVNAINMISNFINVMIVSDKAGTFNVLPPESSSYIMDDGVGKIFAEMAKFPVHIIWLIMLASTLNFLFIKIFIIYAPIIYMYMHNKINKEEKHNLEKNYEIEEGQNKPLMQTNVVRASVESIANRFNPEISELQLRDGGDM
jgi:hypothetical protein